MSIFLFMNQLVMLKDTLVPPNLDSTLTIRTNLELYSPRAELLSRPSECLLVSPFVAEMACKRSPFLFRGEHQCRSVP